MKTLFEKIDDLDVLLRDLNKMKGRIYAGQIIEAWRDVNKIISYIELNKRILIESEDKNKKI